MPEGPEAMLNAAYIKHQFYGYNLLSIESNTKTKRELPNSSIIENCYSYGKIIIIVTKDYYVHIHLGITGWLVDGPEPPRIYKYSLSFSTNKEIRKLFLQDRRRFSSISIFSNEEHLQKIGGN